MIFKYGLMQLLSKFLPGLIGFMSTLALTHLLPPQEFGALALATALGQLVAIALFSWIGMAATRQIAGQDLDPTILGTAFALFAVVALLVAVAGATALIFPFPGEQMSIVAAGIIGSIAFAHFELKSMYYLASMDFKQYFFLNTARAVFAAASSIFAAWWLDSGLAAFLGLLCGTVGVSLLFRQPYATRVLVKSISLKLAQQLWRYGLPLAIGMILLSISGWTDRLVLEWKSGLATVGLYAGAAVLVQNTIALGARGIGGAALPLAIAAYERDGLAGAKPQLEQNLIAVFGFLLPAGAGMCLLAPSIAETMVGAAYRSAIVELTPLLVVSAVLSNIQGNYLDHSFHLRRATWQFLAIAFISAVVNVTALLALVPSFGAIGAALAGVATSAAAFAYALIASRKVCPLPLPVAEIAKLCAGTLLMVMALQPVAAYRGPTALLLQVSLGASVYGAAVVALNLMNMRSLLLTSMHTRLAARRG